MICYEAGTEVEFLSSKATEIVAYYFVFSRSQCSWTFTAGACSGRVIAEIDCGHRGAENTGSTAVCVPFPMHRD